jgi:hypothetical protein
LGTGGSGVGGGSGNNNATATRGSGGSGARNGNQAGSGSGGRCVIRYRGSQRATGGTIVNVFFNGAYYTVHTFTATGTFTVNS